MIDQSLRTLCILVPGTWAGKASWARAGSELRQQLEIGLQDCTIDVHDWPNYPLRQSRRQKESLLLKQRIKSAKNYGRIIVVAHSHGGNIALDACRDLPPGSVEIVTMNTPFLYPRLLPQSTLGERVHSFFSFVLLLAVFIILLVYFRQDWIVPVSVVSVSAVVLFRRRGKFVTEPIAGMISAWNTRIGNNYNRPIVPSKLRILVLYDSRDEVYGGYQSLILYMKRQFSYHPGNMSFSVAYMGNRVAKVDVKYMFLVLLPILVVSYVLTSGVVPHNLLPGVLFLSAPLLPVALTVLFRFFTLAKFRLISKIYRFFLSFLPAPTAHLNVVVAANRITDSSFRYRPTARCHRLPAEPTE